MNIADLYFNPGKLYILRSCNNKITEYILSHAARGYTTEQAVSPIQYCNCRQNLMQSVFIEFSTLDSELGEYLNLYILCH